MAARIKLIALYPLAVGVLLVLMTLLGWSAGRSQSPSYDEPYHIGVGMDIWEQGRLRYEFMNTSFSRRWISFPLIFSDAQVPVDAKRPLPLGRGEGLEVAVAAEAGPLPEPQHGALDEVHGGERTRRSAAGESGRARPIRAWGGPGGTPPGRAGSAS